MNINSIKKAVSSIGASATLLATNVTLAAGEQRTPPPNSGFISGAESIPNTISNILNLVLGFGALVAVVYIIWAGFDYITSSGDPEKAQKARQKIINAVIGLIIIALAFAIKDYGYRLLLGGVDPTSPSIRF